MMGKADCHIHMVLDGVAWRESIAAHREAPNDAIICAALETYRQKGYTYLRDGGDRWGVGKRARELAPEYGITYRTPLAPLCQRGHYGAFIGQTYEDLREYRALVVQIREAGGDFIKIMISGLMDFDHFGVLTEPGYPADLITQLIHIAHEEGMAVMSHCNGARTAEAAAAAGVDSIDHGAYLDQAALQTMRDCGTVWVPTLSTIGNLLGKPRFSQPDVERILHSALENVAAFAQMGGLLAAGTDAGAWAVPHGIESEAHWLARAGVEEAALLPGTRKIMETF